eukprot:scpid75393/ scgid23485/ RING finger protein 37; U-box domain-containing protein 5; Ubiquitin-conjugating enzyme 7-interacting protein 5
MLVNYCHPMLKEYVVLSSPAVAADSYEVTNFQSHSVAERSRGFSTERFIKPPVDIFINFRYPVSVACIIVETANDKSGLEVWTPLSTHGSSTASAIPVPYERRFSQARVTAKRGTAMMFTAASQSLSTEATGTFVSHERLQTSASISLVQNRRFSRIQSIAIRIYFVSGASVPKLRLLEVWASPVSAGWSAMERKQFDDVVRAITQNENDSSSSVSAATFTSSPAVAGVSSQCSPRSRQSRPTLPPANKPIASGTENEVESASPGLNSAHSALRSSVENASQSHPAAGNVLQTAPSEFYDSLTNEMMYTPVLLPSGNNVDVTTLEKLAETDSHWGRKPTDPFTGKILTKTYKAVVNDGLKARIDSFLLRRNPYGTRVAQSLSRTAHTASPSIGSGQCVSSSATGQHAGRPHLLQQRLSMSSSQRPDTLQIAAHKRKPNSQHDTETMSKEQCTESEKKESVDGQSMCPVTRVNTGNKDAGGTSGSQPKRARFLDSSTTSDLSDHERSMNASLNEALDELLGH